MYFFSQLRNAICKSYTKNKSFLFLPLFSEYLTKGAVTDVFSSLHFLQHNKAAVVRLAASHSEMNTIMVTQLGASAPSIWTQWELNGRTTTVRLWNDHWNFIFTPRHVLHEDGEKETPDQFSHNAGFCHMNFFGTTFVIFDVLCKQNKKTPFGDFISWNCSVGVFATPSAQWRAEQLSQRFQH